MSKPWDKLRVPPPVPPIQAGIWLAMCKTPSSEVNLVDVRSDVAKLWVDRQWFTPTGLRELAEFCQELADQLEEP